MYEKNNSSIDGMSYEVKVACYIHSEPRGNLKYFKDRGLIGIQPVAGN